MQTSSLWDETALSVLQPLPSARGASGQTLLATSCFFFFQSGGFLVPLLIQGLKNYHEFLGKNKKNQKIHMLLHLSCLPLMLVIPWY